MARIYSKFDGQFSPYYRGSQSANSKPKEGKHSNIIFGIDVLSLFLVKKKIKNIKKNIGVVPLDQNFIRSQTIEVQKKKLSQFSLIVNFILGFYLILLGLYFPSLIKLDLL
jgi:hypothetical protein